ncbi:MAG: YggT family protein [Brevefilum sp.]|nr:YggT family protein [Brevefilum sp.]
MTDYKEQISTSDPEEKKSRLRTYKSTQIIWFIFGLIEGILGLRFLFKLVAVNPENPFASLLYSVSDLLLKPFASLAGAPSAGGMVFETSTLLAMLIYALIGWALERIIYVLFYKPKDTV